LVDITLIIYLKIYKKSIAFFIDWTQSKYKWGFKNVEDCSPLGIENTYAWYIMLVVRWRWKTLQNVIHVDYLRLQKKFILMLHKILWQLEYFKLTLELNTNESNCIWQCRLLSRIILDPQPLIEDVQNNEIVFLEDKVILLGEGFRGLFKIFMFRLSQLEDLSFASKKS
jgi:hypothetical protein